MKPSVADESFVRSLRRRTGGGLPARRADRRRVSRRPVEATELDGVRGEWLEVAAPRRHVLYLHGGYYLAGGVKSYRRLAARMAAELDANVVLVDYRLAPEHPYPAALDDVFSAYRAILAAGVAPTTVAIAGDSAGGGLALATTLRAKASGLPLPGALVLFSPWTDLTCSNPSVDRNDRADDMLSAAALRYASACYTGSIDPADERVSPGLADLAGMPPVFVTVDESETLLDDSLHLVDRIERAGGRAVLRRSTGLLHIWPTLLGLLPEASAAVSEVSAFLATELSLSGDDERA
jgi:acetyl esterase/lipase